MPNWILCCRSLVNWRHPFQVIILQFLAVISISTVSVRTPLWNGLSTIGLSVPVLSMLMRRIDRRIVYAPILGKPICIVLLEFRRWMQGDQPDALTTFL